MTTMETIPSPTSVSRSLTVTYCDDVRVELHNKISVMGIYRGNMIVPAFPARILRFCIVLEPYCPGTKPYKSVKLAIYRDSSVFGQMDLTPPPEAWKAVPPEGGFVSAVIPFVFENVEFIESAKFRTRAIFDDGEIVPGPSLIVEGGMAATPT